MSNSNGTQTLTKSMNGLIVFNTGGGVIISGDTIIAGNIDLQNLNINEIQGLAPTDNISLYTDTTGNITVGQSTTSNLNLSSNVLTIGGGQNIRQANTANNFTIGGNITGRNFYLGNLVAPPQVPFTATTGFDVVNYDTCVALIGGGGTGILYADDIYMFSPGVFGSLWADNTAGFAIGSNVITNTASQSMGTNNGSLALATISNRSADTFIATGQNHSGNIYLGSGQNSTGNIFIACNNFTGPSGVTTGTIFMGGASTSTRYNGTINIAAFTPSGGTNNINMGSTSTAIELRGSSVNIANTTPFSGTVNICSGTSYSGTLNICNGTSQTSVCNIGANWTPSGVNYIAIGNNRTIMNLCTTVGVGGTQNINYGQAATTHNHVGTQINLNSGNGTANTVSVGSLATTTLTDVAQTINVNSTNGNSNSINIGSSTSTINSYPITPSSGITYNATTGTNIVGTMGYINVGTYSGGTTAITPSGSVRTYSSMNISYNGVYLIQYCAGLNVTTAGTLTRWSTFIQVFNNAAVLQSQGGVLTSFGPSPIIIQNQSSSFIYTFTSTSVGSPWFIRLQVEPSFSSGVYAANSANFAFTATRIA